MSQFDLKDHSLTVTEVSVRRQLPENESPVEPTLVTLPFAPQQRSTYHTEGNSSESIH